MKIYVSSGIRIHTTTGNSAPYTARLRGPDGDQWINVLQDNGIQILKNCYVTTRVT